MQDYGRRPCAYDTRKIILSLREYEKAKQEEEEAEEERPASPLLFAVMLFLAVMPGIIIAFERMYGSLR